MRPVGFFFAVALLLAFSQTQPAHGVSPSRLFGRVPKQVREALYKHRDGPLAPKVCEAFLLRVEGFVGNHTLMVKAAVAEVAAFEGTAAQKAALWRLAAERLDAHALEVHRPWESIEVKSGEPGTFIFSGGAGELLIVRYDGQVFRGKHVGPDGRGEPPSDGWVPDYSRGNYTNLSPDTQQGVTTRQPVGPSVKTFYERLGKPVTQTWAQLEARAHSPLPDAAAVEGKLRYAMIAFFQAHGIFSAQIDHLPTATLVGIIARAESFTPAQLTQGLRDSVEVANMKAGVLPMLTPQDLKSVK